MEACRDIALKHIQNNNNDWDNSIDLVLEEIAIVLC